MNESIAYLPVLSLAKILCDAGVKDIRFNEYLNSMCQIFGLSPPPSGSWPRVMNDNQITLPDPNDPEYRYKKLFASEKSVNVICCISLILDPNGKNKIPSYYEKRVKEFLDFICEITNRDSEYLFKYQ